MATTDKVKVVTDDFKPDQEPLSGEIGGYGGLTPGLASEKLLSGQQVRGSTGSSVYGLATDSSTQSLSSGAFVAGNLATYTLSGVSSGTNSLIVQTDGDYLVTAGAEFTYGADGALRGVSVQKNGSLVSPLQDLRTILSADNLCVGASGIVSLVAGDEIKAYVYNADTNSRNCVYRRLSILKA